LINIELSFSEALDTTIAIDMAMDLQPREVKGAAASGGLSSND
jgi:hypothetical protein